MGYCRPHGVFEATLEERKMWCVRRVWCGDVIAV